MQLNPISDSIEENKFAHQITKEGISIYILCTLFGYRVAIQLSQKHLDYATYQFCCGGSEELAERTYAIFEHILVNYTKEEFITFLQKIPYGDKKPYLLNVEQARYIFKKAIKTEPIYNLNIKNYRKQHLSIFH